jgi:hypothetical protein
MSNKSYKIYNNYTNINNNIDKNKSLYGFDLDGSKLKNFFNF